jgi:uncharacterized protein YciI
LILDADDPDQVTVWLDDDPFWKLGLIAGREIRAWSPFFGANRLTGTND